MKWFEAAWERHQWVKVVMFGLAGVVTGRIIVLAASFVMSFYQPSSAGLPRPPGVPAQACPYYVIWQQGRLAGNTDVIGVRLWQHRRVVGFGPAHGFVMTTFNAEPGFRVLGGSPFGATYIAMTGPLQQLRLCAVRVGAKVPRLPLPQPGSSAAASSAARGSFAASGRSAQLLNRFDSRYTYGHEAKGLRNRFDNEG